MNVQYIHTWEHHHICISFIRIRHVHTPGSASRNSGTLAANALLHEFNYGPWHVGTNHGYPQTKGPLVSDTLDKEVAAGRQTSHNL